MLGGLWLLIVGLLLLFSLILNQVPLILVSLLFLVAVGVAKLWGRYCLSRVEFRRHLSTSHVFFGEEVQLELEVTNRKPMPLPWIQIDDEIPEELEVVKGKSSPSYKETRLFLHSLLSMNWYHRVKRIYRIQCRHRGHFAFGPARIRSGDLFGLCTRETQDQAVEYLTVYPRILPLDQLGILSNQPQGEIRTKNYLFQDPVLNVGVRDYQPGDSLKRIHWKSTARTGQLQTKVYQPMTTVDMGIFLDVRTTRAPLWGSVPHRFELAVISAASLANHAMAEGYSVGLYANRNRWYSPDLIRIPPSQHPDQMRYILEALAEVHPTEVVPIADLVVSEARNYSWGSTMVVISAMPSDDLLNTLLNMRRAGRKVALVKVGNAGPSINAEGLAVYYVREDVVWREMETIHTVSQQ